MTARALIIRSVSSFTLAEAWWALRNLDGPILVLLFFHYIWMGLSLSHVLWINFNDDRIIIFFSSLAHEESIRSAHTINIEMQNNHAHLESYMRNDLNVCDVIYRLSLGGVSAHIYSVLIAPEKVFFWGFQMVNASKCSCFWLIFIDCFGPRVFRHNENGRQRWQSA